MSAYLAGSLAGPDAVNGLTDIDLVFVIAPLGEAPGRARARLRTRCQRVADLLGRVGRVLFDAPMVFEAEDLADATEGCTLSYGLDHEAVALGAVYVGPASDVDKIRLLERPRCLGPTTHWRRVAGERRAPPSVPPSGDERWLAAWLELQYWWRWAYEACVDPKRPSTAHLCVKLAAEPARVWMWLAHGAWIEPRFQALATAAEARPRAGRGAAPGPGARPPAGAPPRPPARGLARPPAGVLAARG